MKILMKSSRRNTSIIEDSNRKPLSEQTSILNHWSVYCRNLYNYPIQPGVNILNNTEIISKDSNLYLKILKSEISDVIQISNEGKSPGIDNILSELIKHGEVLQLRSSLRQAKNIGLITLGIPNRTNH